jgi:hypothetical protein
VNGRRDLIFCHVRLKFVPVVIVAGTTLRCHRARRRTIVRTYTRKHCRALFVGPLVAVSWKSKASPTTKEYRDPAPGRTVSEAHPTPTCPSSGWASSGRTSRSATSSSAHTGQPQAIAIRRVLELNRCRPTARSSPSRWRSTGGRSGSPRPPTPPAVGPSRMGPDGTHWPASRTPRSTRAASTRYLDLRHVPAYTRIRRRLR